LGYYFVQDGGASGWVTCSHTVRNASHPFLTSVLRHTSENAAAGKQKIDTASYS